MKKISQAEARRLRKRVELLEREQESRENNWASDWPAGVRICSVTFTPEVQAHVTTARALKHAVVIVPSGNSAALYACNLRK